MNPDLSRLQPYPFEKLNSLKKGITPPTGLDHIPLSIGEPQDSAPQFAFDLYREHAAGLMKYPTTKGTPSLRSSICNWLSKRFQINKEHLDPERHVLPVNGTREALFAFAQCLIDRSAKEGCDILIPNPFYQIYEGAAYLAGAAPVYLDCDKENGYLPDFENVTPEQWKRCQLLFICSPGNPTGAVIPQEKLQLLINLAEQYNFVIASDECYSEIYHDENAPPPGLLQAAEAIGNNEFKHCVVFHSLSKRSNLPGLRSGFVAGDADLLQQFFQYRTYHGCAMPLQTQAVSEIAWQDEIHVISNRERYRNKFDAVLEILDGSLDVERPAAGFYLWPNIHRDDEIFAQKLFAEKNITVLPGQYLSRSTNGTNPGYEHIRMALVASQDDCCEAALRIRHFLHQSK